MATSDRARDAREDFRGEAAVGSRPVPVAVWIGGWLATSLPALNLPWLGRSEPMVVVIVAGVVIELIAAAGLARSRSLAVLERREG